MSGTSSRRLVVFTFLGSLLLAALASAEVLDLDGNPVDPLASADTPTVFLFAAPDCPISNRYAPEARQIHADYAPQGLRFYLVFPDPDIAAAAARQHLREFAYPFAALLDPDHDLAQRLGATVLSEAAVVSAKGELLYRGRIDDRFVDFGKQRERPTRHDLRDALDAVVAGRPVATPRTRAIGCFIPPLHLR